MYSSTASVSRLQVWHYDELQSWQFSGNKSARMWGLFSFTSPNRHIWKSLTAYAFAVCSCLYASSASGSGQRANLTTTQGQKASFIIVTTNTRSGNAWRNTAGSIKLVAVQNTELVTRGKNQHMTWQCM